MWRCAKFTLVESIYLKHCPSWSLSLGFLVFSLKTPICFLYLFWNNLVEWEREVHLPSKKICVSLLVKPANHVISTNSIQIQTWQYEPWGSLIWSILIAPEISLFKGELYILGIFYSTLVAFQTLINKKMQEIALWSIVWNISNVSMISLLIAIFFDSREVTSTYLR